MRPIMIFNPLIVVATAALAASAQTTTSSSATALPTGSLSPCIISCSNEATAASGCGSYANLTCVCTSTAFQSVASACLQANCTAADIATVQQIQKIECPSSSSTSGVSSSTSTHAASAASHVHSLALDGAFGGLVALTGAFIGAALVL